MAQFSKVFFPYDPLPAQDLNDIVGFMNGVADGTNLEDEAVKADKIDFATFTSTADQTSAITFPSGVTFSDSYLTKTANIAIFTGFFQKAGNWASGDIVATLPVGYRPPSGTFRAASYATGGDVGRVEISSTGAVVSRNVTSGTIVFQLVFPTA